MIRRRSAIALLLALSLVAGACGNSDDDDAGGGDDTSSNTASDVGVTAKEILVGQVNTNTGSSLTAHADCDKGIESYIEMVNEKGGVHGRKIKILAERDDTGESARNAVEIKNLFEQEKVFTVVGCFPQFGAMPYVRDNKLPIIGFNVDAPLWEQAETALAFGGNWLDKTPNEDVPLRISPSPFYVMATLGLTKLGVFSYNHPGSKAASENVCKEAPKYGITCVFEDYTLDFGFTDLGATVDKVKRAGVDFVYGGMDAGGALIINRSLKRAGMDIANMWAVLPNEEQALASTDLIGNLFGVQGTPPFDSDEPSMVEVRTQVEKRKPGTKMSLAVTNGWTIAALLVDGLEEAGPNLTRDGFYKAIRGMPNWVNPFGGSVNFTKSPEEEVREGVKLDPKVCAGFLLRGDAAKKKMVQVDEKPTLCLNGVTDKATLDAKIKADKPNLKTS